MNITKHIVSLFLFLVECHCAGLFPRYLTNLTRPNHDIKMKIGLISLKVITPKFLSLVALHVVVFLAVFSEYWA